MFEYKNKFSLEKRVTESQKIRTKYPDRIPVIVECDKKSNIMLKEYKFLVPKDITMSQFIYVLRRRIKLEPYQSLYCFINESIPVPSDTMDIIYQTYKENDGFLYIYFSLENTFG
jgi:GABA(A) receptor-associated protein